MVERNARYSNPSRVNIHPVPGELYALYAIYNSCLVLARGQRLGVGSATNATTATTIRTLTPFGPAVSPRRVIRPIVPARPNTRLGACNLRELGRRNPCPVLPYRKVRNRGKANLRTSTKFW